MVAAGRYTACCPVCLQRKDKTFKLIACGHEFCYDCILHYVQFSINWKLDSSMACPVPFCTESIHPNDIRCVLFETEDFAKTLDKWEKRQIHKALQGSAQVRWCPRLTCHYAVFVGDSGRCPQKIQCQSCKRDFCGRCCRPWTRRHSCSKRELLRLSKIGKAFGYDPSCDPSVVEIKACPCCEAYVSKDGAQDVVICPVCRFEFCWFCQEDITDGVEIGDEPPFHWTSICQMKEHRASKRLFYCEDYRPLGICSRLALMLACILFTVVGLPLTTLYSVFFQFPIKLFHDLYYRDDGYERCYHGLFLISAYIALILLYIPLTPFVLALLYLTGWFDCLYVVCRIFFSCCGVGPRSKNSSTDSGVLMENGNGYHSSK